MPSSPSNTDQQPAINERLEVPVLPPASSRFVLPPPPSDLLNRLQAFLPQIKSANEQLEQQTAEAGQVEEAVVMEELSSDSDEDDSDSSDSSSDEDQDEDDPAGDSNDEQNRDETTSVPQQGEAEQGTLEKLMDINNRPKVTKKRLVVVQDQDAESVMDEK